MVYRLGSGSKVKRNVNAVTYFGTDFLNREDEPAYDYSTRKSRCYELACQALVWGTAPKDSFLIHGSMDGHLPDGIGRIGHAWLELPNGKIWEPIMGDLFESWTDWQIWADAQTERRYTLARVQRYITATRTFGPWQPTKYR
jgi:hypothetical protein